MHKNPQGRTKLLALHWVVPIEKNKKSSWKRRRLNAKSEYELLGIAGAITFDAVVNGDRQEPIAAAATVVHSPERVSAIGVEL